MRLPHTLLLAVSLLWPAVALAECLPVAEFAKQLAAKYRETPAVRAIQDGIPIVIFASPAGTFTVVAILQSGKTACTLAAGTNWQAIAAPPAGKAS